MSKKFFLYYRGAISGRICVEAVLAESEADARSKWTAQARVELLAIEEVLLGSYKPADPEARLQELLAAGGRTDDSAKPPAKKPAVCMKCWRDPKTEPIDPEAAMRAVRLACGGDPDKGRRQP